MSTARKTRMRIMENELRLWWFLSLEMRAAQPDSELARDLYEEAGVIAASTDWPALRDTIHAFMAKQEELHPDWRAQCAFSA